MPDGLIVTRPEIGYGAWGIAGDAWLGAKGEESLKALNRAVDLVSIAGG